jgi:hypothetical protein
LQTLGPMLQLPLQHWALLVQNQVGLWQHTLLTHDSPLAVSQVHGPPHPSSAPQTLPTLPPPTQPAVGVHTHTPDPLHELLLPLHEPQLPPHESLPQFRPAHAGAHLHTWPLQACPVPHVVPSVLRAHPGMSVSVVVTTLQAPAVQVGVMTDRVRLPELSQMAA